MWVYAAGGIQHSGVVFRARDEREPVDYCSEACKRIRIASPYYLDVMPLDVTAVAVRVAEFRLKAASEKVIDLR